MKNKPYIGSGQLICTLLTARLFKVLTTVPEGYAELGGIMYAISSVIYAILITALFFLFRIPEAKMPKWVSGAAALLLTVAAADGLMQLEHFFSVVSFYDFPALVIIICVAAVCYYCASMGIEPLMRFAFYVTVFFIAACLFIAVADIDILDKTNIVIPEWRPRAAAAAVLARLSEADTLLLYGSLAGLTRTKSRGIFVKTVFIGEAVAAAILLFCEAALGQYMLSGEFPVYSLAVISEISIFRRLDAVYIAIWIFVAVVKISVSVYAASRMLCLSTERTENRAKRVGIISAAAAISIVFIFAAHSNTVIFIRDWYAAASAVLFFVMAACPFFKRRRVK